MKNINFLKKLKKAELHLHLDGSIKAETFMELSKKEGMNFTLEEAKKLLSVSKNDKSLADYLKKFDLALKVLQTKENLERVSYELLKELHEDNYIYAEIRFAPHLHIKQGLNLDQITKAVLKGLERAKKEFCIEYSLVFCIMRHLSLDLAFEILELSEKFNRNYSIAMDLAGDERHSAKKFKEVFLKAKDLEIKYTIHAGEAMGAESVREALDCGTKRLGHGLRAVEDEEVLDRIIKEKIILEICPVSNYQTRVFSKFEDYPIKKLLEKGINLTLNTDNRTVSNTNLIKEVELLNNYFDLEKTTIIKLIRNNIKYSFIGDKKKEKLLESFDKENNTEEI